ncbi:hypothetical protein TNCV_4732851 [Trichonephila clavipes]|nr:hypothetical protein TNCV_4732851 [Trichonephila clavipes]
MRSRSLTLQADVTFQLPQPVFELFRACWSTASNSHQRGTVPLHTGLLLRDRKILPLEGRYNPPPVQTL